MGGVGNKEGRGVFCWVPGRVGRDPDCDGFREESEKEGKEAEPVGTLRG